jgi:uncharacterized protein involved in response to NO
MGSGASAETTGALSGAFFSYGIRLFFLSAGCYAPIVVFFWLGVLATTRCTSVGNRGSGIAS